MKLCHAQRLIGDIVVAIFVGIGRYLPKISEKKDTVINDLNIIYEELREKINFIQYLFNTDLDDSGQVDVNVKKI